MIMPTECLFMVAIPSTGIRIILPLDEITIISSVSFTAVLTDNLPVRSFSSIILMPAVAL